MTIIELKSALAAEGEKALEFTLPDGKFIPAHFHLTEIGFVRKEFIDCGGTVRVEGKCLLQVWVANDVEHRVDVAKFLEILEHGKPVLPSEELPVEVEYEHPYIAHFPIGGIKIGDEIVTIELTLKHTDCLAKDVCGIDEVTGCAVGSGCC
ncbi:MAG: DUF6428 family protein [Verrucomicrobiota bacterium]